MAASSDQAEPAGRQRLYDPDAYPEGHSPFCSRTCTDPCHDEYDRQAAAASSEGSDG